MSQYYLGDMSSHKSEHNCVAISLFGDHSVNCYCFNITVTPVSMNHQYTITANIRNLIRFVLCNNDDVMLL